MDTEAGLFIRKLMDFGKKHLNDVFVTEGEQSISARDKILREVVSNILAHRDYSNGYTAQFVIERDKLYTKNSNLPHGHGELQLNKFEPFPKNPPISKVFRKIGYADELGSGMRNTNKYTKLYSGGTLIFVEDNNFEIIIPIEKVAELQVGANSTQDGTQGGTQNGTQERILELIVENPKVTRRVMAEKLNISVRTLQRVLNEMPDVQYIGTGINGHWEVTEN